MAEISGKVALVVTGAGSGIGRRLAVALAKEGVAVAVADIIVQSIKAVVAEIAQAGSRAIALSCDVSNRASVRAMKAEANRRLGPVSLLFANASVTMFKPLIRVSDDEIDWLLHFNLFGVMHCLKIFLPDMIAHAAVILWRRVRLQGYSRRISMTMPLTWPPKPGVIGLMLSMGHELAPNGIGSTVLCPSLVTTQISRSPLYRSARFGGPASGSVPLPPGARGIAAKARSPELVAQIVIAAVQQDRPTVVTDARRKAMFQDGYADIVLSAFDDAEAFERVQPWRNKPT